MAGGGSYQRATKRHAVCIEHLGGEVSEGFLLAPIGVGFEQYLFQAEGFLPFETLEGRKIYLALQSVKSVAARAEEEEAAAPAPAPAPARHEAPPPPPRPMAGAAPRPPETAIRRFRAEDEETLRRREAAAREMAERMRREQLQQAAEARRRRREADPEAKAAMGVFNLPLDAEIAEVQAAYRREVKIHHPDRLRGLGVSEADLIQAQERLTLLNRAYQAVMASEADAAA